MACPAKPLLLMIFLATVAGEDVFSTQQIEQIDEFVENVMKCSNLPGITLAAVKNGMVFTKGYGKSDIEKDINVTADTLFDIGSVTKTMTSTLLGKILPEKFPESLWDTKVKDILGDNFRFNTTEVTDGVTLKDILSHRTGLSPGLYGVFVGYPDNLTRADLAKRLQFLPQVDPLRYKYSYNNWMYFLAGYLTEVLAGGSESWENLLQRHLFRPLGMTSTAATTDLKKFADEGRMSLPYIFYEGALKTLPFEIYDMSPLEPAGSVYSSANDIAKWMKYLVNPPADVLTNPALLQTMAPVQVLDIPSGLTRPIFPVVQYMYAYGLGFFVGNYRGQIHALHSGNFFAHTSTMWIFRSSAIAVFVSTNGVISTSNLPKEMITAYVTDLLLGITPWVNVTTACSFPAPWVVNPTTNATQPVTTPKPTAVSQRPLSEYVGTYGHGLFGDADVFINDTASGRLEVKLGKHVHAVLHPTEDKDVFEWEFTGIAWAMDLVYPTSKRFHFEEGDSGRIEAFKSASVGEEFVFRRDMRFWYPFASQATYSSCGKLPLCAILIFLIAYTFSCDM